jgi:signal transduction histidine kinase/CheY-like chemotaxis protein
MNSLKSVSKLHRLLERQLKKIGLTGEENPQWKEFIQQVNQAYINFDEQNKQLERILDLSGNELFKANARLNGSMQELEKMVLERTNELRKINEKLNEEIAERKQIESELKLAIQNADKANRTKAFFLSNMSHEIRTPMHAIVGLTELLLQENHDPLLEEKLKSIKFAGENLKIIVDDILDFSKMEAGKLNLEKVPFPLEPLIQNLVRTIQFLAREKPIKVELFYDPVLPLTLVGDPTRLLQILTNLGANAVKFTRSGSVSIKISLAKKVGKEAIIHFEFKDTGIGIPAHRLHSIFESFEQAETQTTRNFGGSGLGLTICKLLAGLIGGDISVKSEVGQGSTFLVTLPFVTNDDKEQKDYAEKSTKDNAELSHLRVLLVEDNKINQFLADQILKKWSIVPQIVQNGKEAIDLVQTTPFDIVLMDLQMPEMNGFEAADFIRKNPTLMVNPRMQIIALTADAFPETKEKVKEVGMNDFISKPFSQEDLRDKITKAYLRSLEGDA